jgi:hypothetical protein
MSLSLLARKSLFLILALLIVSAALAPALRAQGSGGGLGNTTSTPVPGVPHDYIVSLNEIVNPANGALSIRIGQPVPHERGQNWPKYAFMYDSNQQFSLLPTWSTTQSGNGPFTALELLNYVLATPTPGGWQALTEGADGCRTLCFVRVRV